jgi:hypothetical protein
MDAALDAIAITADATARRAARATIVGPAAGTLCCEQVRAVDVRFIA